MKKTYISPVLEVIRVQTQQMIATSVAGFNSTLGADGGSADGALAPEFDSIFDEY